MEAQGKRIRLLLEQVASLRAELSSVTKVIPRFGKGGRDEQNPRRPEPGSWLTWQAQRVERRVRGLAPICAVAAGTDTVPQPFLLLHPFRQRLPRASDPGLLLLRRS